VPTPRHRAPNDLLGGVRDVGGFVDERRVLTAEFEQDRVRFSAAARATTLPVLVLPVKKMKSNGSLRSSVVSSR
jgi:hypothetical protein